MDKCYFVNSENGYVIVGSKLANVKLIATITRELEEDIEVSLRCSYNGKEFEVHPKDFYLTREAFERSEHATPGLTPIAGKVKGLVIDDDLHEIYSWVIGDDGIPYKKKYKVDYVEAYYRNGYCDVNIPEIKEKLYRKKEWAIENTTYTEVCPDGTEKTHVGLSKLLELTVDQKAILADINDLLKKLYDSGVKLERTNDNGWYAINTNRVKSARVVSGWDDSKVFEERDEEETVLHPDSLKVDLNFNYENDCDCFCIRVER